MAMIKVTPESLAQALAEVDWAQQEALTDAEIEAAVAGDPDAAPIITPEAFVAGRVRVIRKRTGLSQPDFAARYGIPLDTLRDWESATTAPDATARSYLQVIAHDPDAVARALAA